MSSSTVDHIMYKMQDVETEVMAINNREDLAEALFVLNDSMKCIKARVKLKLRSMED